VTKNIAKNEPDKMNKAFKSSQQDIGALSFWAGLPFKIVWVSALTGLVLSILVTAVQLSFQIKAARNDMKAHVHQIMSSVSESAADAAYEIDTEKARTIANGIFNFSDVDYVKIDMDIGGTLVEKVTPAATKDFTPMTVFLFGSESDNDHKITLYTSNRLESVGSLSVRLNLNGITDKFIRRFLNSLFFISIGVMIFSGMMGYMFYILLAKPLIFASTELGEIVNNVDGNIQITILRFHRKDELGHLLASINSLMATRKRLDNRLLNQQRALDRHAIVSMTDISGKITSVNEKFLQISGYTRKELIGKTHRVIKSGEHSEEFYADLWKTISSGKPWTGEIRNLRKDLSSYWVKATIYPFLNADGKIYQYIAIRTDITKLKEKEAEIEQFKSTLDDMKDEVYMFWPDTFKIFYVNRATLIRTGLPENEICKLTPIDMCVGYEKGFLESQLNLLLNGTEIKTSYQSLQYHNDGSAIPVETFIELIEPEGEKPRFVVITRDISKDLEVEKTKNEFIATVSHELRTPLTSILGGLGLVRTGALGAIPKKATKALDVAYKNSERLKNLINDILDLEKSEAGMLDINVESLDISALILDAMESNKSYGDEYDITFVASGINDKILVDGDASRILQVLANLMSNAAKFSHKGGVVEIALAQNDALIRVTVKDFGSGIPDAAQASIFEKFTQADSSDQRQKGGSGLGLSIAKSLVTAMGGSIGFTSEVGKGTTFFFDLKASRT